MSQCRTCKHYRPIIYQHSGWCARGVAENRDEQPYRIRAMTEGLTLEVKSVSINFGCNKHEEVSSESAKQ